MKIFAKKWSKNLHIVKAFSIFVMSERLKSNPDILKILKYAAAGRDPGERFTFRRRHKRKKRLTY